MKNFRVFGAFLFQLLVRAPFPTLVNCEPVSMGRNLTGHSWNPPASLQRSTKDTCALLREWDKDCECIVHNVPVGDGYTVKVMQVPSKTPGAQRVYVQHGLLSSSDDFAGAMQDNIVSELNKAGFEVWLGNIRGNTYGCQHSSLSINDKEFWGFKLQDISKDLEFTFEYMAKTGSGKLHYIGHSMGCAMLTILAHCNSNVVEKYVNKVVFLAPAVFVKHATCPPASLFSWIPGILLQEITNLLCGSMDTVKTVSKFIQDKAEWLCNGCPLEWCQSALTYFTGSNSKHYSNEKMARIMSTSPSSSGPHLLENYIQWINSGTFSQFDYGMVGNLATYWSLTPPAYKINRLNRDTMVMYGDLDTMTVPEDVETFIQELQKSANVETKRMRSYDHLAFCYDDLAYYNIYRLIVEFFNK